MWLALTIIYNSSSLCMWERGLALWVTLPVDSPSPEQTPLLYPKLAIAYRSDFFQFEMVLGAPILLLELARFLHQEILVHANWSVMIVAAATYGRYVVSITALNARPVFTYPFASFHWRRIDPTFGPYAGLSLLLFPFRAPPCCGPGWAFCVYVPTCDAYTWPHCWTNILSGALFFRYLASFWDPSNVSHMTCASHLLLISVSLAYNSLTSVLADLPPRAWERPLFLLFFFPFAFEFLIFSDNAADGVAHSNGYLPLRFSLLTPKRSF